MAVYSNLPTFTYVKWDNMMIAYDGQVYPIQNSHTNNKYVYFDTSNPYQLLCSNEKKAEIGGRFLIIINEKGIHTLVPHENLLVTFDGDNSDLIAEKIYGIYETNEQFGERFTSIETDIEGMKTTVGKVERENNEIKETVSTISQKADQISQEVKNVEKAFNESQDNIDLRERLNKSIIEMNSSLGIFKSYFGDVKTGSIDEKTKIEINTHIDVLIKNKDAMILQVNRVEVLMEQGGFTDKLNSLKSSKTAAINAIDNLVTIIRSAISDNNFVPSEITMIVDAFGKANTKVNVLKNSCDDCIFLGTGGSVVEELSRLDMKSDSISLSVSKTEESLKNTLSINKAQAQGQIQDLHSEISKFKQALKTIFEDGSVTEIEKGVINEHYGKLDKEKSDIDNLYNTYVSDVNLSKTQKDNLISVYNNFVAAHNSVKNKINEVIKDSFINESEIAQVESELLKYEDQSNQLLRSICYALDDIEINRNNKAVQDAKNEIRQEINEVDSKIGDLDNTINTTFKDNVIDEAERNSIKQNLNILKSEKVDIDNQYNQLYKNVHLSGQLKVDFKSAYDDFVDKYNSLVSIINGILSKPTLIEDSDRRNRDNAYELMNTSLANFTSVANKVIESVAKKEAESVKSQLDKDIEDIHVKIDGLDTSIDGTFANNILDKAERKDIKDNLNTIKREKIDVDNQYNQLVQSPYLDGQLKTDYMNKYKEFVSKFNTLEEVVTGILEKVDFVDDTDRTNITSAQNTLNVVIGELVTLSNKVIEHISKKQSETSLEDLNGQIGDLNNKVDNMVGDVTNAVSDTVLDKSERQTLKESLKNLNTQKSQVDSQYSLVYNNPNIANSPKKSELKTAYDGFTEKYNLLITSIENLLNKEGNIINSDREVYTNAYNEYKTAISNYTSKLQLANEEIFNKGIETAKQQINGEMADISRSLEELSNTMNGVFKDGILSESEKISIRQNLKNLESEKLDIDKSYNTLYSNSKLVGSAKVNLKSSYDDYVSKYNNLISVVNGILDKKGLVDSTDQKNLNNAFDLHKTALGDFREKYNLALDSVTNKSVEDMKQLLKQDISDVRNSVNNLQDTMEGVFKDGILSDSEKLAIKQNLQSLLSEKTDIDKQYTTVYNNVDLLGSAKTNLKTAYDDYILKYNILVNTINTIINKIGIIDGSDKSKLDNSFNDHKTALGVYSTRINEAIDSIAKKKSDDAYNNSKKYTQAEIKVMSDQITSTVSENYYSKGEIDGKGYQNSSQVQQTVDALKFKFQSSGGYNLCRNGDFRNNTNLWETSHGGFWNNNLTCSENKFGVTIKGTLNENKYIRQEIECNISEPFTVSFWQYTSDGSDGTTNPFRRCEVSVYYDKGNAESYPGSIQQSVFNTWEKISFTFRPDKRTSKIIISLYNRDTTRTVHYTNVMIEKGEMHTMFTPNPNEIHDGITTINKDGVQVNQTNAKSKTSMSADGFAITRTDNNKDIFRVGSNGLLTLNGVFKCYKDGANMSGARLEASGAIMFGYNQTGGNYPTFASGLWTDENLGYVSVGYTRADISDENGCLYISPQVGNQGGRLTFSRLVGSVTKSSNLLFQKDGSINFVSNLKGQNEVDNVYTYNFDAGVSAKSFMCDNLRCKSIFPLYSGTYDLGSASQTFKDVFAHSLGTTNSQLELGTLTSAGKWEQYGALGVNSSSGYLFPVKSSGAFSLGTSNNRFSSLYVVNPVSVGSDKRNKTDIHYLNEENNTLNVINEKPQRLSKNMNITTNDMYNFIKDDLKLASYRYEVNLEKGITDVDYGFIAQDILYTKVGSEIVQLEDKNDLESNLSYNQGNYISVIAGALQEEIRKRDEENKLLKAKIEDLESKIDKLLQIKYK